MSWNPLPPFRLPPPDPNSSGGQGNFQLPGFYPDLTLGNQNAQFQQLPQAGSMGGLPFMGYATQMPPIPQNNYFFGQSGLPQGAPAPLNSQLTGSFTPQAQVSPPAQANGYFPPPVQISRNSQSLGQGTNRVTLLKTPEIPAGIQRINRVSMATIEKIGHANSALTTAQQLELQKVFSHIPRSGVGAGGMPPSWSLPPPVNGFIPVPNAAQVPRQNPRFSRWSMSNNASSVPKQFSANQVMVSSGEIKGPIPIPTILNHVVVNNTYNPGCFENDKKVVASNGAFECTKRESTEVPLVKTDKGLAHSVTRAVKRPLLVDLAVETTSDEDSCSESDEPCDTAKETALCVRKPVSSSDVKPVHSLKQLSGHCAVICLPFTLKPRFRSALHQTVLENFPTSTAVQIGVRNKINVFFGTKVEAESAADLTQPFVFSFKAKEKTRTVRLIANMYRFISPRPNSSMISPTLPHD